MITEHFLNYRFDYVGTLLARNPGANDAIIGAFSPRTLLLTVLALLGTSVVPLQLGLAALKWFQAANMSTREALSYSAFVSIFVIIF